VVHSGWVQLECPSSAGSSDPFGLDFARANIRFHSSEVCSAPRTVMS
jgi:hypothetical protein